MADTNRAIYVLVKELLQGRIILSEWVRGDHPVVKSWARFYPWGGKAAEIIVQGGKGYTMYMDDEFHQSYGSLKDAMYETDQIQEQILNRTLVDSKYVK